MTESDFIAIALENPINRTLLDRLPDLGLPHAYLTAGCLFQTLWNRQSNRPLANDINDYDIFYHDPADLSWDAEDAVIRRVTAACADLGVTIEVKNQARVHLWYQSRFGTDYPSLHSSEDGIARFLVRGTCVGIQANARHLFAPFGISDLAEGLLRPNPNVKLVPRFWEKSHSYQSRWPHLRIEPAEPPLTVL